MNALSSDQLRFRKLWVLLGAALLILFLVLSLIPYTGPDLPIRLADKLVHAFAFTILLVWFSALVKPDQWARLVGLLMAYGALMEVLQSFTDYRIMDWEDLAADVLGLSIGWCLIRAGLYNWARWIERLLGHP